MRKAVERFRLVEEILLLSDWSKRKACLPVTLIVKVEQKYFVGVGRIIDRLQT